MSVNMPRNESVFDLHRLRHVPLSDPQYAAIETALAKSYPRGCILAILAVDNIDLTHDYDVCKSGMRNEGRGWHGTKYRNLQCILDSGFDPHMNVTSAYGKGTYIARDAVYSRYRSV